MSDKIINIIKKKDYPEIWEDIYAFFVKHLSKEHRRNSNFYTTSLFKFDADNLPEHPALHGLWESDCYITDPEYGGEEPDELYRVVEKKRMIEEVYYERA